jgi:hypothetical protein
MNEALKSMVNDDGAKTSVLVSIKNGEKLQTEKGLHELSVAKKLQSL